MTLRVSRETGIGIVLSAVAVVAMALEHVLDGAPSASGFVVSAVLSLAVAAVVFGGVVPRTKAGADVAMRAATRGLTCSLLADRKSVV